MRALYLGSLRHQLVHPPLPSQHPTPSHTCTLPTTGSLQNSVHACQSPNSLLPPPSLPPGDEMEVEKKHYVIWTLFSVNFFFDVLQWVALFIAFFYLLQKMREDKLERGGCRGWGGAPLVGRCPCMEGRELPSKERMPLYGIVFFDIRHCLLHLCSQGVFWLCISG